MVPLLWTIVLGSSHMPENKPPSVSTFGPKVSNESAANRPTPTRPRFTRGWLCTVTLASIRPATAIILYRFFMLLFEQGFRLPRSPNARPGIHDRAHLNSGTLRPGGGQQTMW